MKFIGILRFQFRRNVTTSRYGSVSAIDDRVTIVTNGRRCARLAIIEVGVASVRSNAQIEAVGCQENHDEQAGSAKHGGHHVRIDIWPD
jgi:hypothetical protein